MSTPPYHARSRSCLRIASRQPRSLAGHSPAAALVKVTPSNTYVVYQDQDANAWIGTSGGGLQQYRDGVLTSTGAAPGMLGDYPTSIFQDRTRALWIGTNTGGLVRLQDGRFTVFAFSPCEGMVHANRIETLLL